MSFILSISGIYVECTPSAGVWFVALTLMLRSTTKAHTWYKVRLAKEKMSHVCWVWEGEVFYQNLPIEILQKKKHLSFFQVDLAEETTPSKA